MPNYIKLGNLRIEIPAASGGGGGGGGSSSLLTGLLAFYNFSDNADASGNNRTLTNNGGVTFSAGKIGNAAQFSTSSHLVSNVSLAGLTSATLAGWFKYSSLPNTDHIFGALQGNPAGRRCFFDLYPNDMYFIVSNGGHWVQPSVSTAPDGVWRHFVGVVDENVVKIYLNGVLGNSASRNVNPFDSGIPPIAWNYSDEVGGQNSYAGLIDAFGIWNRALTDAEVTELYNAGTGKEHPFA